MAGGVSQEPAGKTAGRRGRRPLQLKCQVVPRERCGGQRTGRPTEQQRKSERGKGGRKPSPDGAGGAEPRPYAHPISHCGGSGPRLKSGAKPVGRGSRLAAHNERRQFAAQTRSCGCLPRRGKHCSLPQFRSAQLWPRVRNPAPRRNSGSFLCELSFAAKRKRPPGRLPSILQPRRPTPYCGASGRVKSSVKLFVKSLIFIRTAQNTSP